MQDTMTSESISALSALQSEVGGATKKGAKGHGYNYVKLDALLADVMPAVTRHGFALVSSTREGAVSTQLLHSSGDTFETIVPLDTSGRLQGMQAIGSAITYARRYAVMNLLGIAGTDDDGLAASAPPPEPKSTAKPTGKSATLPSITAPLQKWLAENGRKPSELWDWLQIAGRDIGGYDKTKQGKLLDALKAGDVVFGEAF